MKKLWNDIVADPVGAFLFVLLVGASSAAFVALIAIGRSADVPAFMTDEEVSAASRRCDALGLSTVHTEVVHYRPQLRRGVTSVYCVPKR